MFPGVYGFTWDAGNLIFLGLFFSVAIVMAATVVIASLRAWKDFRGHKDQAIRWDDDFRDLPAALKVCRHELNGEVAHRTCPHAFDCRTCSVHPQFLNRIGHVQVARQAGGSQFGFDMPSDRLYHRGHTWVQKEEDGTLLVGLDDFGRRVFGTPDAVDLPQPGTHVQVNGTGWTMSRDGHRVRVLSPVDGEIVAVGTPGDAWTLKVRPIEGQDESSHLLSGNEVRSWIMRELEHLEIRLGDSSVGPSMADGGEVVPDLPAHYPKTDWDAVWGEMFLEP